MRSFKLAGFLFFVLVSFQSFGQDKKKEKIVPIDRVVKGEIITTDNDTVHGKIKIANAADYYITSIKFSGPGYKNKLLTAYEVRWFRQIVPYPDREAFGVDEVFFKSGQHPQDKTKKVFLPAEQ